MRLTADMSLRATSHGVIAAIGLPPRGTAPELARMIRAEARRSL
jgi:hypothetical protein